jgi:lysozyme family protein
MNFDQAFDILLGHEGGYSNNPFDPGGETNWGITVAVARVHGYTGSMRSLSKSTAKDIYRKDYWDAIRADELPELIRYAVFDAAVNSGVKQSAKWLQQASGATPDGIIGPKTLAAVRAMDQQELLRKLLAQRLQFFTNLKTWDSFGKGWARRIASLLEMANG